MPQATAPACRLCHVLPQGDARRGKHCSSHLMPACTCACSCTAQPAAHPVVRTLAPSELQELVGRPCAHAVADHKVSTAPRQPRARHRQQRGRERGEVGAGRLAGTQGAAGRLDGQQRGAGAAAPVLAKFAMARGKLMGGSTAKGDPQARLSRQSMQQAIAGRKSSQQMYRSS
jgi:hypothetical protein